MVRRSLPIVLAVVGLTIIQCAILLQFDWHGEAASEQADPIDTLLTVMIILSSVVFAVVMVALIYFTWRYRAKPGDESDGEPIHGNTKLEIIWTVIPTLIVLFGAAYSWIVLEDIEDAKANRMKVNVTAEQFAWTFSYPGQNVVSNELVVPVNRQVEFTVTAKDVIHAFWVPEWRIKRDAVPDDAPDQTFVVDPNKTGSFPLVCTEYCGVGHPTMRANVRVVSQEQFRRWIAENRGETPPGADPGGQQKGGPGGETAPELSEDEESGQERGAGDARAEGSQVFTAQGCGSCHMLAAANANGSVGPDLDESLRGKDVEYIRRAILNPDSDIARGFARGIMPRDYEDQLSEVELRALVELLREAAEG